MCKSIICPNCGNEIALGNDEYASIVNQVRNEEFNEEVEKRLETERVRIADSIKLAEAEAKLDMQAELSKKDEEILRLNKVNEDLTNRTMVAVRAREKELSDLKVSSSAEISRLNEQIRIFDERQASAVNAAIAKEQQLSKDKDVIIASLREALNTKDSENKLKISDISNAKDKEIAELNSKIISINTAFSAREAATNERHIAELKAKDEEISFYKDFKSKLSIKMIGESLEEHCYTEYSKIRPLMPSSTFKKDTEVSPETGSKGDFIFRDFSPDKIETLSIMFEMKNEAEDSLHKHKNKDYFKELDKDRREKGCEYAILVSTLEADSELYNQGIVDVSDQYEKMYVIRPQFFLPIITLLRNAALKSADYRKELEEYKAMSIDVSTFEADLDAYKESIAKSSELATKKKDSAIEKIDKTILLLQAVKEDFIKFDQHMTQVNAKAEKVTIKKLTSKTPSIASKLEEIIDASSKKDELDIKSGLSA